MWRRGLRLGVPQIADLMLRRLPSPTLQPRRKSARTCSPHALAAPELNLTPGPPPLWGPRPPPPLGGVSRRLRAGRGRCPYEVARYSIVVFLLRMHGDMLRHFAVFPFAQSPQLRRFSRAHTRLLPTASRTCQQACQRALRRWLATAAALHPPGQNPHTLWNHVQSRPVRTAITLTLRRRRTRSSCRPACRPPAKTATIPASPRTAWQRL